MAFSYKKILSVGELNENVHQLLSSEFKEVFVKGEISNLAKPSSGHIYFSLKDQAAQVRCALFKSKITSPTEILTNGVEVIVCGTPSIYTVRGDYQIIIDYLETAGEGLLRRKFEELKLKLMKEGLFESSLKKSIEKWPSAIGIITSPTGAAVRDIISVIKRRAPSIPLIIYPCRVQGKIASRTIVEAIEKANQRQECSTLILTRGGGTLEDLWPFNEETTVRAIAKSKLPILSAVGHETDFTISDMVADTRAATPSAAAEMASPDTKKEAIIFRNIMMRLNGNIELQLQEKSAQLNKSKNALISPENKLLGYIQLNDELCRRLQEKVDEKLRELKTKQSYLNINLKQFAPKNKILDLIKIVEEIKNTSERLVVQRIQKFGYRNRTLHAKLVSNNPKSILKRGYSITYNESNKIVNKASSLKNNSRIKTIFYHGAAISKIERILK